MLSIIARISRRFVVRRRKLQDLAARNMALLDQLRSAREQISHLKSDVESLKAHMTMKDQAINLKSRSLDHAESIIKEVRRALARY